MQQSKMLEQAQKSALGQWEMALKADPRSYTVVAEDAAPAVAEPQADGAAEQPPLDNMAASGA